MKWKESDFTKGLSTVRAVLIYGPDAGQIDEHLINLLKYLG